MSTFHQWNHIAGYIFPVIIAFFIGSWSDKRGRKIPLLIGLTGKLIYVLALLLNIHYGKVKFEILKCVRCPFNFGFVFFTQKNGQSST